LFVRIVGGGGGGGGGGGCQQKNFIVVRWFEASKQRTVMTDVEKRKE